MKACKIIYTIFFLLLASSNVQAQFPDTSGMKSESYIDTLLRTMRRGPDDEARIEANQKFDSLFLSELTKPESFNRNFDYFSNVSIQNSQDGKFRIYTWTLASFDGSLYTNFGYLQMKDKNGVVKIIPLVDSTLSIIKPESEKLKPERWLGCVYYTIIPVKKSGKTYYTLLGWKGMDTQTSQKLIEVLYFDNDIPKFGYPLLKTGRVFRNRMIFSYMAQLSMVLRYEDKKNIIVFDHLSDGRNKKNKTEANMQIGPDGTYDAFKFKGGKWIMLSDIDIPTDWDPKKLRKPSKKKIKN